jgi:hypothetical protein
MTQRELAALVVALGAHAVFMYAASTLGGRNLLFDRSAGDGAPIEIEVEVDPLAAQRSTPAPPESAPEAPRATAGTEPRRATPGPAEPAPAAVAPEPGVASADEPPAAEHDPSSPGSGPRAGLPAPGSADEYGEPPPDAPRPFSPSLGPSAWGLPGVLDFGPAPAAPTEAPKAREIDPDAPANIVASTLRDRDAKVGVSMPATQVVASAVSVATRSVSVPHNTRAKFEVKLGPGGSVVSSRVISSSGGDATQWAGAAKSVAASLKGTKLDLGMLSKSGATVVVNVTTKHVFPAGTSKAADVKPVCANQIINDVVDSVDKSPDAPAEPVVPLFQDENGRPCIPVGMKGVSDAANVGAQKQVQVQTTTQVLVGGKAALPTETPAINRDPFWVDTGKAGPRPVAPFKARKYKRDREKKK